MSKNLYIILLVVAGAVVTAYTLPGLPADSLPAIALLGFLGAAAQRLPVTLFASSSVSVTVAFAFAGLLIFGPAAAILVNLPSVLVHALYPKRRPFHKTAFNLGLVSCTAGISGIVYSSTGGQVPVRDYLSSVGPVAIAAVTYFLVQSAAVTAVILLSEGGSFASIWRNNYRWLMLHYLGIGGVSMAMALAYQTVGPLGLLSFSLPLVMAWYSLHLYVGRSKEVRAQNELLQSTNCQLEATFFSTIRALTAAANTKDHYTHDHSEMAMHYAAETARRMGLDPKTVTVVQVGALFHDIGKLGISEPILRKPGPLDQTEWELMRQHPVLGANVIRQVEALAEVVPAVLYHHERVDGTGYPSGLKGPEIPLAAQIVSVVDSYQAMTSDRPYRRAWTHEQAVAELRGGAGSQFNPWVVESFIAAREDAINGLESPTQVDLSLLLRKSSLATSVA